MNAAHNHHSSLSVIVPTLNAENLITQLVDSLKKQTITPNEIIIVDSESDDKTTEIASVLEGVTLISIKRKDFNHATTRDMALRKSTGDYVIFITQDAMPADEYFVEKLLQPFSLDDTIAVSTGRQIPRYDAWPFEKLVREFNYPAVSQIRSSADIPRLGIKTFFMSDCCSAYKRDIFVKLGGFSFPVKTAEDLFFAARVINSGYKIAYVHEAGVIHSHNLTLRQQYTRNFILAYEMEKHKDILRDVPVDSEGINLVMHVSRELLKYGRVIWFVRFGLDCVARFLGNRMGKRAYREEQ